MTLADRIHELRVAIDELERKVDENTRAIQLQQERIGGERGLSAAINTLSKEVTSLRRAAYWIAGLIIAGSVTFSFGVLALIR